MNALYQKCGFAALLIMLLATILTACGSPTDTPVPATVMPTVGANPTATPATGVSPTAVPATVTATSSTMVPAVSPTVAPPVSLVYWTHDLKGNKKFEDYLNGLSAAYMAAHPGTTVVWQDYSGGDIRAKLLTAIASNSAPDVVNFNTAFALQFASNGALTDLNTLMTADQKAAYYPWALQASTVGAATYNIPWYVTLYITIYNKDLFTKAGLDPNSPPKNQDDLVKVAQAIHDKTDNSFGFQPIQGWSEEAAIGGFPVLSPDGKTSAINNPGAVARLQWYDDLKKKGLIPNDKIGFIDDTTYDAAVKNYEAGKIGVLLSGASLLNQIKTDAPAVFANTGVAPFVVGASGKIPSSVQGFVLPKAGKNQKAALDLGLFVTNDKNQLEFSKVTNGGVLPSTVASAQDPYFTAAGTDLAAQAKLLQSKGLASAVDASLVSTQSDALSKAQTAEFAKWWGGQEDAATALKNTDDQWNKILSTPAQ